MEEIGFIGLGIMGRPMALNLVKGGYKLSVYSRRAESAQPLLRFGAQVCASPREVAEKCDVVITMLRDSTSVREILLGEQGIIGGAKPGTVLIDMSSIDPAESRELAKTLAEKSIDCIDAPVSGGEQGAKDGTLSIMVGGPIPVFRRVKPLLQMMGNCTYVGEHGCGQIAKACNQLVITQTIAAVAEALLLATAAGADPENVREAMLGGSAYSKVLEIYGKRMLGGDFQPGFKAVLLAKDMAILRRLAQQCGIALEYTERAAQAIEQLGASSPDLDSSAMVRLLEQRLGVQLPADSSDNPKKKKVR